MTGERLYTDLAQYYELIDQKPRDTFEAEIEHIGQLITEHTDTADSPARVLDIGCGNGAHAELLEDRFNIDVYCADANRGVIQQATDRCRPPVTQADMRSLPYQTAVFDAVICLSNTLAYAVADAGKEAILQEIYRVLTLSGLAVVEFSPAPSTSYEGIVDHMTMTYENEAISIAAVQVVSTESETMVFEIEYLIWDSNVDAPGVRHEEDVHVLGMLAEDALINLFNQTGFDSIECQEEPFEDTLYLAEK